MVFTALGGDCLVLSSLLCKRGMPRNSAPTSQVDNFLIPLPQPRTNEAAAAEQCGWREQEGEAVDSLLAGSDALLGMSFCRV